MVDRICKILDVNGIFTLCQPLNCILEDGSMENNPYYSSEEGSTYWSYKLVSSYGINSGAAALFIPIQENIREEAIDVQMRVLSRGFFENTSFDFTPPEGVFIPEGFRYLRIPISRENSSGESIYYRLKIYGYYKEEENNLRLETIQSDILDFEDGFTVPGESESHCVYIGKESEVSIINNSSEIRYTALLINTGCDDLKNVLFKDTIRYPHRKLRIGSIKKHIEGMSIHEESDGLVTLKFCVDSLPVGESIRIPFTIPIDEISLPGLHKFYSTTQVFSSGLLSTVNTSEKISAVELSAETNSCVYSNETAEFSISLTSLENSPRTKAMFENIISIPEGITMEFEDFSGCDAIFLDNLEPVELNREISGGEILITCISDVLENNTIKKKIIFRVLRSNSIEDTPLEIKNSFENIMLRYPSSQVLIGDFEVQDSCAIQVLGKVLKTESF